MRVREIKRLRIIVSNLSSIIKLLNDNQKPLINTKHAPLS